MRRMSIPAAPSGLFQVVQMEPTAQRPRVLRLFARRCAGVSRKKRSGKRSPTTTSADAAERLRYRGPKTRGSSGGRDMKLDRRDFFAKLGGAAAVAAMTRRERMRSSTT